MKALIYRGTNKMSLDEIAAPELNAGHVLVRVRAVGICGSDIHGFAGKTGRRAPGMVMGHEIAGEVAGVGDGVTGFAHGMKVAVQPILFCGTCALCRAGRTSICLNKRMIGVNMGTVGGLSELLSVPAVNVFRLRPEVPCASACLAEPLAVGESAARAANIAKSETALIVGAGMIGQAILLALRERNPQRIFITDNNARRLAVAQDCGGVPIDFSREDPIRRIMAETQGTGVDVAIEAVGMPASVATAQRATRTGGRLVWIGNSHRTVEVDMQDVVVCEKSIQGVYCYSNECFGDACAFLQTHPDEVARYVEHTADMSEAFPLFLRLAKGDLDLFRGVVLLN